MIWLIYNAKISGWRVCGQLDFLVINDYIKDNDMNTLWFLVLLLGADGEHTLSAHLSEKECHAAAKVEKVVNYICRSGAEK